MLKEILAIVTGAILFVGGFYALMFLVMIWG